MYGYKLDALGSELDNLQEIAGIDDEDKA